MKSAFEELEFGKVKALIRKSCISTLGQKLVNELHPLSKKSEIEDKQQILTDTTRLLKQGKSFSLQGLSDTEYLFDKIKTGELFTTKEFLQFYKNIEISNIIKQKDYIKQTDFPYLFSLIDKLHPTLYLEKLLKKTFDEKGKIKDTASKELALIRKKYYQTKNKIYSQLGRIINDKKIEAIIQDKVITLRDRRYVIPIKVGKENFIKGFVHARSQSGVSIYVEPIEVLELNNKLQNLQDQEKEEIQKILRNILIKFQESYDYLLNNLQILKQLDYLNAAAKYCKSIEATKPEIKETTSINLKNARHPLLFDAIKEKDKIVPFTLSLGKNYRLLVISGVNTGGKTVTLKATGLLVIMALSGLLVSAKKAEIGIFHSFYTDINDEQSIENSISTFSSHVKKIENILAKTDNYSLVLIDELGTGTDPEEGSAFAQAVLEELISRKSKVIITTHINKLKIFATKHALCENASMRFDQEKLIPSYILDIGFPGNSYAMDIASKYNLPPGLIQRAKNLIDDKTLKFSKLLKQTEQQRVYLTKIINEYETKKKIVAQKLNNIEKKEKNWGKIKKEEKKDFLKREEEYLTHLQLEFENKINQLKKQFKKEKKIPHIETKKIQKKISKEKKRINKEKNKLSDIKLIPLKNPKVGELVYIKNLDVVGKVHKLYKNFVKIITENLIYSVKKNELFHIPQNMKNLTKNQSIYSKVHTDLDRDFSFELNVMGLTFEEAKYEIDKYIDKAILLNYNRFRILHGKGRGQLRSKIWKMFKGDKRILEYHEAPNAEGGYGVTIAILK